jgi:hypothetical protein
MELLVGQTAVIACAMIAVCHLHHQKVGVLLAGVLIQKSIGFQMIAGSQDLLSQYPLSLQQPNVRQVRMFLDKQQLLLLI